MKNAPALTRYRATRSWIAHGSTAFCFAVDDGELIRVEVDRELTKLLREKIPEDWWPC
jgi:hypothetical protein